MCQHLKTLAISNDYRHITCCEHGTIHLSWDLITIHLDGETLVQLVQVLEEGSKLVTSGRVARKHCQVFYCEKGCFQIWIRNVALNLLPADFLVLAGLVRVASTGLSNAPGQSFADASRPIYGTVRAPAGSCFSLN